MVQTAVLALLAFVLYANVMDLAFAYPLNSNAEENKNDAKYQVCLRFCIY